MEHRITIGIDPSISCAGIAIFEGKKLIQYGTIKTKPTQTDGQRLKFIYDALNKVDNDALNLVKRSESDTLNFVIGMETPFLGNNIKSFMKLSYVQALIHLWTESKGFKLRTFSPMEVKLGVTGKGNATKEEVAHRVTLMYPSLKGVSFDVTDAVAIALCTGNLHG